MVTTIGKFFKTTRCIFIRKNSQALTKAIHSSDKCFSILRIIFGYVIIDFSDGIRGTLFPNQADFFFHSSSCANIWAAVYPASSSLSISSRSWFISASVAARPGKIQSVSDRAGFSIETDFTYPNVRRKVARDFASD